jgi:hypothetical protein
MANEYTLTYAQNVEGWVSFYSYYPDWMIGMNNYFYTFKGGNLYRHNTNPSRNTFYTPWWTLIGNPSGSFSPSTLSSVFNQSPLDNKLFKTINLEGDSSWAVNLHTDLQYTGFIESSWFEKKEQSYYAFVRNNSSIPADSAQYPLRNLNGIGRSVNWFSVSGGINVLFAIPIDSIISIGDYLYFSLPPYDTPQLAGQVISISRNLTVSSAILIDPTIVGAVPIPIQDAYFLSIKNSVAESHGVLGHYCVFDIENTSTSKVELFAVETDVMKSFP